jgi:hypothetical protein
MRGFVRRSEMLPNLAGFAAAQGLRWSACQAEHDIGTVLLVARLSRSQCSVVVDLLAKLFQPETCAKRVTPQLNMGLGIEKR